MIIPEMSRGSSVLSVRYSFGMNKDCKQCIELGNGNHIFYSAGSYLIKHNLEDQSQQFGHTVRGCTGITAMCLNSDRKYIAVARKGLKPHIQILDTSNQFRVMNTSLAMNDEQAKYLVDVYHMSFSIKSNRLAVLNNRNAPSVTFWEGDQMNLKIIATHQFKGYECIETCFSPLSNDTISVIGTNNFQILQLGSDNIVKQTSSRMGLKKETPTDFSCHTWLSIGSGASNVVSQATISGSEKSQGFLGIIVCTKSQYIYVLKDNGDVLYSRDSKEMGIKDMIDPYCIVTCSDGFYVAGEGLRIQKYTRQGSEFFTCSSTIKFDMQNAQSGLSNADSKATSITNMKIDQDDDRIICLSNSRSIFTASIKMDKPTLLKETMDSFTIVDNPGHSDKISFMDYCVRKPLFITCSPDKTVKVWDYEERKLINNLCFTEEPYAVAFHPSGYHIAVAFTEKVQLLNLYIKSKDHKGIFREYAVKNCRFIKFSHGGDLLAIASGDAPPEICIYRTYDLSANPIHKLKGHTGTIRCLEWAADDFSLFSCGMQGMIYKWNLKDNERKEINPKKIGTVNDMCVSYDNNMMSTSTNYSIMLAVDEPESLRELSGGGVLGNSNIIRSEGHQIFGAVVKSADKKMIFAGIRESGKDAREGSIYFYRHPLAPRETDITYAHNGLGVSKMILTPKDRFLITGGMDGTIFIFEVEDKDSHAGGGLGAEFKESCQNILVTQGDIKDLKNELSLLNGQLVNDTGQSGNMQITGGSANDAIKNKNDFAKLKTSNEAHIQTLLNEKKIKEEEKKKQMETEKAAYKNKMTVFEVFASGNLNDKQETVKDMENIVRKKKEQYERELQQMRDDHQREMENLIRRNAEEESRGEEEKRRIEEDIEDTLAKNQTELAEIIKESIDEHKDLKSTNDKKETDLKTRQVKLKNDLQSNDKKLHKLRNTRAMLEEKQKEAVESKQRVQTMLDASKREIQELENELKRKNVQITASERRIYDEKKKTGGLEKFKYVLDYKIKELKKDMEPKDQEIELLKIQTTKADTALKKLNLRSNELSSAVRLLEEEQKDLLRTISRDKKTIIAHSSQIKGFKKKVYEAIEKIQDYPKMSEILLRIRNKNVKVLNEIDEDIKKEYQSQLKYLAMSSRKLKKNLEKDAEMHKQDNMRIMKKNVDLIRELGKMRSYIAKISGGDNRKADHHNKIKGLRSDPENTDNKILEQGKIRETLIEQIEKLTNDLKQLKLAKPKYARELEEEEIQEMEDQQAIGDSEMQADLTEDEDVELD